jgi:hypothetical protein
MNDSAAILRFPNSPSELSSPGHLRIFLIWLFGMFLVLGAVVPSVLAQNQDVSSQFPEPARVTADYPDDVQRWGALNVLYAALNNAAPKPMSKAAYAKFFAYGSAYNAIATSKMANRQAYADFNSRCEQLFAKPGFGRSVLEKYGLTAYARRQPTPTQPTPAQVPANSSPPSQRIVLPSPQQERNFTNDEWPYPQSFPLLLFFLLPVAFCTWVALQVTGSGRAILPTRPPLPGGLPELPESLRVVRVPGARYAVYVLSGMVLQKEENVHTHSWSSTTPGSTTHMGGGQFHHTPGQTTTHSETTREEIIWVRTPQNLEQSWTLYNSGVRLRPGQIVSVLVRPLPKDTGDILLAYNHTTGTIEKCPAMEKAHGNQGFIRREIVQWTGNLACGLGSAIVTVRYLPAYVHGQLYAGFIVWWLFGSGVLVTLSFLIVTPFLTSLIRKRRDAAFDRKYLPGLRQFFEQGTSILQRTFGQR